MSREDVRRMVELVEAAKARRRRWRRYRKAGLAGAIVWFFLAWYAASAPGVIAAAFIVGYLSALVVGDSLFDPML